MAIDERTLQPFGLGPQNVPSSPDEVLRPGESTVTMVFPVKVLLNTDDGYRVEFAPGVQEVPEHLAGHWWLKANKVTDYNAPIAKQAMENAQSVAEAQAAFDAAQAALVAAKAKAARSGAPIVPVQAVVEDAPTEEEVAADKEEEEAEEEERTAKDDTAKRKADADLILAQARKAQARQASGRRR
jgi:hypothetical protein